MIVRLLQAAFLAGGAYFLYKKLYPATLRPEKPTTYAQRREFLRKMSPYIGMVERDYGIKGIIFLSQAALESNYGTSGLYKQANNIFGIKATKSWIAAGKPTWSGMTEEFAKGGGAMLMRDTFRKYDSLEESIRDWASLIKNVYKTAYKYASAGDVFGYGEKIYEFGYSTHPRYAYLLQEKANQIV